MTIDIPKLKDWYTALARPFIQAHQPTKVRELDDRVAEVQLLAEREGQEVALCVLGQSGVGKSTLINAVVAGKDWVLPAGGIGPLTASAMEVRHGAPASFVATYHEPVMLGRLLFALEQHHRRSLDKPAVAPDLTDYSDEDNEQAVVAGQEDGERSEESRIHALGNQARLMVKGRQDADAPMPYLLDALRLALGRKSEWAAEFLDEDRPRLDRLRTLMAPKANRVHRRSAADGQAAFQSDLKEHAAGALSPLIKELKIYWPSEVLSNGAVMVDLPGVGIATDAYKQVTQDWVRAKARAILLVVNRSGISEADAQLLRSSGFLTRLMFSADDPTADPVTLAVVVTQLDNVAKAHYQEDRSKRRAQHLAEAFEKARSTMNAQLAQQLKAAWQEGDGFTETARAEIIARLVAGLQVFPVSAFEYRQFLERDPEEPSFISSEDESGIPALAQGVRTMSDDVKKRAHRASQQAFGVLMQQVLTTVKLIEAQWKEQQRSREEVERLRDELEEVLAPLRKEFQHRQGAFREFLRETVPQQIKGSVEEAKGQAERSIRKYLGSLRDVHWGTLRAAVRRSGTFHGSKYINLPDDFAQMFVEPLAEVWGRTIIQSVRKRTKEFSGDCVTQVEGLVKWCRAQGARVQPALVEAQLDAIRADAQQIDLVGKTIVQELREEVKVQLIKAIEVPIRHECQLFVRRGKDIGPGVKVRMLEMFDELETKCVDAAQPAASQMLNRAFRRVEAELKKILDHYENPLDQAAEAILSSHEERLKRSDAQKRSKVLAEVEAITAQAPETAPMVGVH